MEQQKKNQKQVQDQNQKQSQKQNQKQSQKQSQKQRKKQNIEEASCVLETSSSEESCKNSKKGKSKQGKSSRKTRSFKHVDYEHHRPQLTKDAAAQEIDAAAQETRANSTQNATDASAQSTQKTQVAAQTTTRSIDPNAVLKVIPLGGLDGIGKNMTVFECKDDLLIDDAGLMFPDDDHPGIDLILPDYTYVLENAHKLRGIVITHGHEDHTGALPYLLKDLEIEVPIYASKLTLGLIEGKLKEHSVKNAKLIEVKSGTQIHLGCLTVDFFSVNHSIPGALGVFLQSPAGTVLHTGDFKLDQTPIDGVPTDFAAITRFSERGIDLLMSDSTNAQKSEFTPSEAEVGRELDKIIAQATGKVLIASFASHIHRMQQICDAAVANGRKVVVTGRSMIQNTDIARRLGYLRIGDADIIDAYELSKTPADEVVVLCTGSQGEPLSALARIANGEHRTVDIDAGDTVIISATPVPGNEKAVTRVINSLAKIGADVYDKNRAMVHVSGHGGAEELKLMLILTKPTAFMPVHGESMHLHAHAQLARQAGVCDENIFICDNGETLELSAGVVRRGEAVESGIVYVDGLSVGDTSQDVLDERNALGDQGFAVVSAAYSPNDLVVVGDVQLEMRGITGGDDAYLLDEASRTVALSLKRALAKGSDERTLRKIARDSLLSILWERIKQRPMVIVNLLPV